MHRYLLFILILTCSNNYGLCQFTQIPLGTNSPITDLELHGDTLIIIGTDGYLAKTHDLGNNINQLAGFGLTGYANFEFQVRNNVYYYIAVEGAPYQHNIIFKSIDFGNTWTSLYDTTGLFYSFHMRDSTWGIMGGTFGSFAMTEGNDTSWALDSLNSIITCIESFNDTTLLMLTLDSYAYLTEDKGQTWTQSYYGAGRPRDIQFISKDSIYTLSSKPDGSDVYFKYSLNGGANFTSIEIDDISTSNQFNYYSSAYKLDFLSKNHGYIIGYLSTVIYDWQGVPINKGTIFETFDYGQTWDPRPTEYSEQFYSYVRLNDSISFIGGENGLLLKWNRNINIPSLFSTQDEFDANGIDIFPNPVSNDLNLKFEGIEVKFNNGYIFDITGRQVLTIQNQKNSNFVIDCSLLPNGTYFLELNLYGSKIRRKIQVVH